MSSTDQYSLTLKAVLIDTSAFSNVIMSDPQAQDALWNVQQRQQEMTEQVEQLRTENETLTARIKELESLLEGTTADKPSAC